MSIVMNFAIPEDLEAIPVLMAREDPQKQLDESFGDLSTVIGETLSWRYVKHLRPQLVLGLRDGSSHFMEFRRRSPLSLKQTSVLWRGFAGTIDRHLTGPSWLLFLPGYRGIQDFYTLRDARQQIIGVIEPSRCIDKVIELAIGKLLYHHTFLNWRRYAILSNDDGDILIGQESKAEIQVLRQIDDLPAALALFWFRFFFECDG